MSHWILRGVIQEITLFLLMRGGLGIHCCNPCGCSAPLWSSSSPVVREKEVKVKWKNVRHNLLKSRSMFAVRVCHRSERTDLREGRFVDTVNVRFGLLFNLVSVRFVTDCAVYQRLHERTQTKKKKMSQGRLLALPNSTFCSSDQI